MKVRLSDIKVFDLDTETVLRISKFIRLARKRGDRSMRLSDPAIVKIIFSFSAQTKDTELRILFLAIRRSIRKKYASMTEDSEMIVDRSSSLNAECVGWDAR